MCVCDVCCVCVTVCVMCVHMCSEIGLEGAISHKACHNDIGRSSWPHARGLVRLALLWAAILDCGEGHGHVSCRGAKVPLQAGLLCNEALCSHT